MTYGKRYNELKQEDFTVYEFKEPFYPNGSIKYEYNEWICHIFIMDFDMNEEKTASMTEDEKQELYDKLFDVACKQTMNTNMYEKLNSVGAYYHDAIDGSDIYLSLTIPYFPKELYPNLVEWINDEPLSDIDFHGISLKKMVDLMDFPPEEEWQKFCKSIEEYRRSKARHYLALFKLVALYAKTGSYERGDRIYVNTESMNMFRKPVDIVNVKRFKELHGIK